MKKAVVVGAVIGVLAFSAFGISFYAGTQLESGLQKFVAEANMAGTVKITKFEHHGSTFSSEGRFLIQAEGGCLGTRVESAGILVDYSATHLPSLNGPLTLQLNAHLNPDTLQVVELATGTDVIATVKMSPRWIGGYHVDFNSSAMNIPLGSRGSIKVAASSGAYHGSEDSGSYSWTLPSMTMSSPLGNAVIHSVLLTGDSIDLSRDGQHGSSKFTIGDADIGLASVKGFEIDTHAARQKGLIDVDASYKIDRLDSKGLNFSQGVLSIALKGLDARTILELNKKLSDKCALQKLDQNLVKSLADGLGQLAFKGFSQTLKVSGVLPEGKASSVVDVKVQIPPGQNTDTFKLSDSLSVHFGLDVSPALAQKWGLSLAFPKGLSVQTADNFSTVMDYRGREVLINGKPTKGTEFDAMGALFASTLDSFQAGRGLQGLFGGPGSLQSVPAAPAEEPSPSE